MKTIAVLFAGALLGMLLPPPAPAARLPLRRAARAALRVLPRRARGVVLPRRRRALRRPVPVIRVVKPVAVVKKRRVFAEPIFFFPIYGAAYVVPGASGIYGSGYSAPPAAAAGLAAASGSAAGAATTTTTRTTSAVPPGIGAKWEAILTRIEARLSAVESRLAPAPAPRADTPAPRREREVAPPARKGDVSALYQARCALCHQAGREKAGDGFVLLKADGSLADLDATAILNVVRKVTTGKMPKLTPEARKAGITPLTDDEAGDILDDMDRKADKLKEKK